MKTKLFQTRKEAQTYADKIAHFFCNRSLGGVKVIKIDDNPKKPWAVRIGKYFFVQEGEFD